MSKNIVLYITICLKGSGRLGRYLVEDLFLRGKKTFATGLTSIKQKKRPLRPFRRAGA
jgi:hypothetical protein